MGKTIARFYDNTGNPVSDATTVTLTRVLTPFTVYTGTLVPSGGGYNNGMRIFESVAEGDYVVKYGGVTQTELSNLYIPGPPTPPGTTIGVGQITSTNIADNAITNTKIINNAVTAAKIQDGAITSAKIGSAVVAGINIAAGAISKSNLGANIFNDTMEDTGSGWGLKYDNATIVKNGTGRVLVGTSSITAVQLADNAVTANKILANAVTSAKIGTGVITGTHIANSTIEATHLGIGSVQTTHLGTGVVTTTNIADNAITGSKIGTGVVTTTNIADNAITSSKIGTSVIGINQLELALRNSMLRFPSKVAFVSPEFSDNEAPYFDNLEDAITSVQADNGTVYIYPGTYLGYAGLGASVNLIGMDKTRCIIQANNTEQYALYISNMTAGKDILIKDITLKLNRVASAANPTYGIYSINANGALLRLENLIISVVGSNNAVTIPDTYGVYLNNTAFILKDSQVEVRGGDKLTSNGNGGLAYGIYLINASTVGTITDTRAKARGGAKYGTGIEGVSKGIYWGSTNPDVILESCTIDINSAIANSTPLDAISSMAPTVLNCLYNDANGANIQTTKLVGNTQDTNILIYGQTGIF